MAEQEFVYGGFWRRLAALLLDTIIVFTIGALGLFLESLSRSSWIFDPPGTLLFSFFYGVYLVRRFGGTPGKMIMRLRVLRVNGEPVRYREAVIRYLPDLFFSLVTSLGATVAALSMTDGDYLSHPWFDLQEQLELSTPRWSNWADITSWVWTCSEVIVLLTNRKRRALHDFLAGTVVIVVQPKEKSTPLATSPTSAG